MDWWSCNHEAKGVKGCPICDDALSEEQRILLRKARNKIFELKYQLELKEELSGVIKMNDSINEIKKLIDRINQIYDANQDWEVTYDLIFHFARANDFYGKVKRLGLQFDYYDPDTSYEEDVTAFVNAVLSFKDKLPNF